MINYNGLYNKDFYGDLLEKNHFHDKKLHFKIIENGTILPFKDVPETEGFGGLVDAKGNFIKRSSIHVGVGGAYTPIEEIKISRATVIYLGMFFDVWGHCLTDNLKRVWFLKSDIFKQYFKNCPIVYTPMRGGVIENFAKLLKILEIDPAKLYAITRPIRFQSVIFPDESFFLDDTGKPFENQFHSANAFYTQEYLDTIEPIRDFARKNFQPLAKKKFFTFHGKYQIGEERLANYFQSKGYEIIRPEKFSLEEQLNIFANCESFASTVGSASHGIMFLKDHSEVILIPRWPGEQLNTYQEAINRMYDLQTAYIDASLSTYSNVHQGPFCYIISEQLKEYFGDDWNGYSEEDFIIFLNYVKYSLGIGRKESPVAKKYCSPILPEFISQLKKREDLMQKIGVNIN